MSAALPARPDGLVLRQTVLDCTDARRSAEFHRQLLGLTYRAGDEPPAAGDDDPLGRDWLVLFVPGGGRLAFQQVPNMPTSTWPDDGVPQQLHLDLSVGTPDELDAGHELAVALGARLVQDRSTDPDEPLRVYADPDGHPFCIFMAGSS